MGWLHHREWSIGWGLRTLVWSLVLLTLPLSHPAPPLTYPLHLHPLIIVHHHNSHIHMCARMYISLQLPGFNTLGFSRALKHTEKSGKSVPHLIELKDWGLAGHCVSELQLLPAFSVLYRTVQAPFNSSCCCSSPLFPSPTSLPGQGEVRDTSVLLSSFTTLLSAAAGGRLGPPAEQVPRPHL